MNQLKFPITSVRSIDFDYDLNNVQHRESINSLAIANAIFSAQKYINENDINEIIIEVLGDSLDNKIVDLLSELFSFAYNRYILFKFAYSEIIVKHKKRNHENAQCDAGTLFSGGIDSLSGIITLQKVYDNIEAIFCAHSDNKRLISIVNGLFQGDEIFKKAKYFTIKAPNIGIGHYSQLRGVFYILSAVARLNLLNSNRLYIFECGPTMYQPKFNPIDIVTLTSNPVILSISQSLLDIIFNKKVKIYIPFEDLTKAEVMSLIDRKNIIPKLHSCITQRFGIEHCGVCYGCIVRRLASTALGIQDVPYRKNPLLDSKANSDNLIPLLIFSQEILIDYDNMEFYKLMNIHLYNKKNLFYRFALDNFTAIHQLLKKGVKINPLVYRLYNETIEIIGVQELIERIDELKKADFTPQFDLKVKF